MSKYKTYKTLDLPSTANKVLQEWESNKVFENSISKREGKTPYIFFEGPPSANGLPGIHHIMGRTIKDVFCRYKTLKGFQVKRKGGWDTHGLPVELGVEKQLGITKEDIGKTISIEDYNRACKEAVMRYTDVWHELTSQMGYWIDMDDPYITYKSKYMESVWWLLAQLYKKNMLYKGYTVQPYSPKAGTGLSSHELNQPGCYRDVTDTTVVAQFKINPDYLKQLSKVFSVNYLEEIFFLAWTTTPWTLPSNTALTIGKNIDYSLVESYNQYTFEKIVVVLATNTIQTQFSGKFFRVESNEELARYTEKDKKIPYRILGSCKGIDLIGIRYEQLLPYVLPYKDADRAFQVIAGEFVTTEDGTGIVHTAPTFGADDAKVAQQENIPGMLIIDENGVLVPLVDLQGKFRPEMGDLAGMYVKNEYYPDNEQPEKSVDVLIAIKLKEQNRAFRVEKQTHSYPHCWRTDKPVLYYPLDSWFIRISETKNRMVELNNTINWKPTSTGQGRFGKWLENANDWNLSRSRYWGIPIPIWRSEDQSEELCIGSIEELKTECQKAVDNGIMSENPLKNFQIGDFSDENYSKVDLHKNYVDNIILISSSGKPMYREADLCDVWFDSGSMPYAQWHYPFENKELIDNNLFFPADFIAEGVDQTRGWFYTLHAIAASVFDSVAFKNVVSNGLVLDKLGQKMSKRLGNTVEPKKILDKYGPDATRWYMISNAQPWDNLKFDEEGIVETQRKFFGTLYNTYSFFALYANIDGFHYDIEDIPINERPEIDRWIISKLHSLIREVDRAYNDYEPTKVARLIQEFTCDQLSNWHVRLSRRRFWKTTDSKDKTSAYQTLYTCLETVALLGSPIAPFFMDQLFNDLNKITKRHDSNSVHLCDFPRFNASRIDERLETQMDLAQRISSLALSIRKKERIRVRQPLKKLIIPAIDNVFATNVEHVKNIILSETNIKELEILNSSNNLFLKQIKPNFSAIGPKYGKLMKLIAQKVNGFSSSDIENIEKQKIWKGTIEHQEVVLELNDFQITAQDIPGFLVGMQDNITIAIDHEITDELFREGIARELVNRVQNWRKECNLEVTDHIILSIETTENIQKAISDNKKYITRELLAVDINFKSLRNKKIDNMTTIELIDSNDTLIHIEKITTNKL